MTEGSDLDKHPADPKGLIRESYRIDGISPEECRSIFFDWAISAPADQDTHAVLQELLTYYGAGHLDHPMTKVMIEGMAQAARPKRRGGWRGRDRG